MDDDELPERYQDLDAAIIDYTGEYDVEALAHSLATGEWLIPIRWVRPSDARTDDSPAPTPNHARDPGTPTDQPPPH